MILKKKKVRLADWALIGLAVELCSHYNNKKKKLEKILGTTPHNWNGWSTVKRIGYRLFLRRYWHLCLGGNLPTYGTQGFEFKKKSTLAKLALYASIFPELYDTTLQTLLDESMLQNSGLGFLVAQQTSQQQRVHLSHPLDHCLHLTSKIVSCTSVV